MLLLLLPYIAGSPAAEWDPLDARWALHRHSPGAQHAFLAALSTSPHFLSSALRVETDSSDGGLRVVAARPLKRGELVLRVDAAHALSARTAFADADFAPRAASLYAAAAAAGGAGGGGGGLPAAAAAELRGDPERRLAFLAWLHHHVFVLRGASPWAPLLRALPTAQEVGYLPLLWGERDAAAAAGAPLFGALLAARRALAARSLAALRGSFWRGGSSSARATAELAYLEAILDSRSYAAANPVDAYSLLPFVDLFNHAEGAQPPGRSLRPFNASRDAVDPPGGPVFEGGGVPLAVAGGGAPFVPSRAAYRIAVYTQVAHADVAEGAEVFSNYGGGGGSGGGSGGGGGGGDGDAVKACAASRLLHYGFSKGADCGALRAEDWAAGCGRAAGALARAGARRAAPPGAAPLLAAIDALAAGGGGGDAAPWEMAIYGGDVEALASAVGVAAALAAPAGAEPAAARASAAGCLRGAAAAAAARTRAAHAALQAQWAAGAPGPSAAAAAALGAVFEGAARAAAWAEGAAEGAAALAL